MGASDIHEGLTKPFKGLIRALSGPFRRHKALQGLVKPFGALKRLIRP